MLVNLKLRTEQHRRAAAVECANPLTHTQIVAKG